MSRPKTQALTDNFNELLKLHSEGQTIYRACKVLNINRSSFYVRLDLEEKLQKEYAEAHKLHNALLHDISLEKVLAGKQGWQSGAWYLERIFPEKYGLKRDESDKNNKEPVTIILKRND